MIIENKRSLPKNHDVEFANESIKKLESMKRIRKNKKMQIWRVQKSTPPDPVGEKTKLVRQIVKKSTIHDQFAKIKEAGIRCLEYRRSKIRGDSGNGVFVSRKISSIPANFVIPVAGELRRNPAGPEHPRQHQYVFKIAQDRYWWGYTRPRKDCGLGAFINRAVSEAVYTPENGYTDTYIHRIGNQNLTQINATLVTQPSVYFKTTKEVKSGEEILASYGPGFRIPSE